MTIDAIKNVALTAPPYKEAVGPSVHISADPKLELRQSEVITGISEFRCKTTAKGIEVEKIVHPYAIVLSQDCDLLREHEFHLKEQESGISNILLFQAEDASLIKPLIQGRDIWKRIIQNNDERYHFLQRCQPSSDACAVGLPALIIDFRKFFTLPPR